MQAPIADFALRVTAAPDFTPVLYYLVTLFGASAMYVFSLNKGFEGSLAFLKRVAPGKTQVFYDRVDFVIVIFAGSVIGTIFFSPVSTLEALAAGFGWVGAINILLNKGTGQ